MKRITTDEVKRWKLEIEQSERYRDREFGTYTYKKREGVGKNLDYFEYGESQDTLRDSNAWQYPTINIIFPIVKNIIPSLYYRNPKIISLPKRRRDEDSAPMSAEILNYYHKELNIKEVNQHCTFDAYVLGMGVCKVGYATQFGADVPDEGEEKRKRKEKERGLLAKLGISRKKKEEDLIENPEMNEFIRRESPYVIWISPFDFLMDPRANSIYDAQWVAHRIRKTIKEVKSNPNYTNTSILKPVEPEEEMDVNVLTQPEIEAFQTVDLYEIHYRTEKGINILTLAKDSSDFKALRHEESAYEMEGFQFEVLTFNKHGHKLYPRPDISIVRGLQDKITNTFDAIIEQIDKFVSKVFYDDNALTVEGRNALQNGEIGAFVKCNKDPNMVAKEFSMVQIKADMAAFVEKIIDVVVLIVGLTRAQLTGLTTSETATGEQIGQSGANLRRSDQSEFVIDFVNRQSRKLWQVIQQFVDLDEVELITGEPTQAQTGEVNYNWKVIDEDMSKKLIEGEYSFDIEVGSAQKPDMQIIRQQAQNMVRDLFNPVIEQTLVQEGTHLNHTELLRRLFKMFPEFIKNTDKVLQQATQGNQQLQALQQFLQGGGLKASQRGKSAENAMGNEKRTPPTPTTIQEEVAGEQQGGFPGGGI